MNMIPTINMVGTGRNITVLRKEAGLSVRDLQEIFGFTTPQAIYKWQQGVALPSIENLLILSKVFGISMDDIIVLDNPGESRKSA